MNTFNAIALTMEASMGWFVLNWLLLSGIATCLFLMFCGSDE